MKKTKKLIIAISIFAIAAISCLIYLSVFGRLNPPIVDGLVVSRNFDYASLKAFEDNLIEDTDIHFDDEKIIVSGTYFDGVRLYVLLSSELQLLKEDLEKFILVSNENDYKPDILVLSDDIKIVSDDNNSNLLIFNTLEGADLTKLLLSYNTSKTTTFSVSNDFAKTLEINDFFEEIDLNSVTFGETSTLLVCEIIARIEAVSFQVRADDIVVPVYVVKKDGQKYTFSIPINLDENSKIDLISNNGNSIELRVPIDFSSAFAEEILE